MMSTTLNSVSKERISDVDRPVEVAAAIRLTGWQVSGPVIDWAEATGVEMNELDGLRAGRFEKSGLVAVPNSSKSSTRQPHSANLPFGLVSTVKPLASFSVKLESEAKETGRPYDTGSHRRRQATLHASVFDQHLA